MPTRGRKWPLVGWVSVAVLPGRAGRDRMGPDHAEGPGDATSPGPSERSAVVGDVLLERRIEVGEHLGSVLLTRDEVLQADQERVLDGGVGG